MSRDKIEIKGIEAIGYHGVYHEERREGQRFIADLTLTLSNKRASKSDRLEDAVDYSVVISRAYAILTGTPFNLIERLAGEIADTILREFKVKGVEVVVHKPDAPVGITTTDIAVRIKRSR